MTLSAIYCCSYMELGNQSPSLLLISHREALRNSQAYANLFDIPTLQLQRVITQPKMALSCSEKEASIQEATDAWQSNPERTIADIAPEFNVSPWAFCKRLHGVPSKIEGGGHNKKLAPDGEQALIQHIQLLEVFGIAPRPKFLRGIANSILRTNNTDPSTPPLLYCGCQLACQFHQTSF